MYSPTYELACFSTVTHEEKLEILKAMLEALILANVLYLGHRPDTPPLYACGVPYVVEPPGRDNWQDIPRTLALREGDCTRLSRFFALPSVRLSPHSKSLPQGPQQPPPPTHPRHVPPTGGYVCARARIVPMARRMGGREPVSERACAPGRVGAPVGQQAH